MRHLDSLDPSCVEDALIQLQHVAPADLQEFHCILDCAGAGGGGVFL